MKRFNYAVTPVERLLGTSCPPVIAPLLYAPLCALAAALVLLVAGGIVQEARVDAAERAAVASRLRLAAADMTVARVQLVRSDVTRLRTLAARITGIRRSGTARASEIAALGNALPADAWLTAVRVERRTLGVEGRATGLGTVAAAMSALARLPAYTGARLVNVRQDSVRADVTYAIALEVPR